MSAPDTAPIGVFGGTFDPIHHAHLRLAIEARQALGLETLRLIPAGQPPHREQPGSSADHRLAMAKLATQDLAGIEVDSSEVLVAQPSYTVATLERLRQEVGPGQPLVLIVGADAFLGLPRWHRWLALFDLAHIAIATRPGYDLTETMGASLAQQFNARHTADATRLRSCAYGLLHSFDMTPLAISATAIRQDLQHGRDPRFLLPDAVLNYIQTHMLYQKP